MNIRAFIRMDKKDINVRIIQRAFHMEKNVNTLIFDFGSYDLNDKNISLHFKPTDYTVENIQPDNGLIFIPVVKGMLIPDINKMQFTFSWEDNKIEQSPFIVWQIDESIII